MQEGRGTGVARRRVGTLSRCARAGCWRDRRDEGGFTLVELLIVVAVLPIIVGALSYGLMTVLSLQSGVSNRLSDSGDAQVVTASYVKDIQTASEVTTDPTAPALSTGVSQCGTGTQLLGLYLGTSPDVFSQDQEVVSYVEVQNGTTYTLVRNLCAPGSSTPSSSTTLSFDVLAPCTTQVTWSAGQTPTCQDAPVVLDGTTTLSAAATSWLLVDGSASSNLNVTAIKFSVYEPQSKYTYVLDASPVAGSSTPIDQLGAPDPNPTWCGFALPGTGYYAQSLCFIGFTASEISAAQSSVNTCNGSQGTLITSDIPGGYTMTFCLSISAGASVEASGFPTWGGAFLGNDINGTPFYSGVGCPDSDPTTTVVNGQTEGYPSCISPAIYEDAQGETMTVTVSNLVVTAPSGNDASGYEVVTADAETTDPGESITWTSELPSGSPLVFNQIPDTSSSPEGDACNEPAGYSQRNPDENSSGQGDTNGGGLSGVGTYQVECQSTWQSSGSYPRTGTVLLGLLPSTTNEVTQPVTISATLVGTGLEGVAFGLLLP